jgi:hypothetical protein
MDAGALQRETDLLGIDESAVSSASRFFDSGCTPLPYACFAHIPEGSVRLLALPIAGELASALLQCANDCAERLRFAGARCFVQKRSCLHCTVSFLSLASETSYPENNPSEALTLHSIVNSHCSPKLAPEQLALTRQGVLILTLSDRSGTLCSLRSTIRQRFPCAPSKQPQIKHVTLLRILSAPDFDAARAACNASIAVHQHIVAKQPPHMPAEAWLSTERIYSTLEGETLPLPFGLVDMTES